jgi:DNA repair exonuclease SbcCD ATPase subunit
MSIKIKSLQIINIGMIESEVVSFNKPLLLFFGEIKQGKTTILNAVRWAFGGPFPTDILRHGQPEGLIRLNFEGGSLVREFYRTPASGEIKARPLSLTIDGIRQARPVDKLKALLNPFLLDQEHLVRMTELERKKYFADLFHTATPELDAEKERAEQEARELRSRIKGYGDIDLTEVKPVNLEVLRAERMRILIVAKQEIQSAQNKNVQIQAHNMQVEQAKISLEDWKKEVADYRLKMELAQAEVDAGLKWLEENPKQVEEISPASPDVTGLDKQIENGAATNVRAETYQANLKRQFAKDTDGTRVASLEQRTREIRDERIAKLKAISEACGVPGLEFLENGEFLFEGTQAGMLSTSQLMKLSSLLSSLYPEGIGLDLIDRGESLGASIFELIERAKSEDKTILATVVGERPATVPENVGVFVVKDGKLS